jgi:hypothetical protein
MRQKRNDDNPEAEQPGTSPRPAAAALPSPGPDRPDADALDERAIPPEAHPIGKDWAKCSTLALLLDFSTDTIERAAVPWDDDLGYVPYKIRYREAVLRKGARPRRRYYVPDGMALLRNPPKRSRAIQFQPAFRRPPRGEGRQT